MRRSPGSISTGGWIAIAVVVLLGGLLLGLVCGGESTLTRAQLIAQGDAICAENNAALSKLQADPANEVDLADTDAALAAVERLKGPGLDTTVRMAELVPEPEVAARYDEFIRLRHQRDELQNQVIAALRADDPEAAGNAQTQALRLYNGPIRDNARLIGFEVCGQPLDGG